MKATQTDPYKLCFKQAAGCRKSKRKMKIKMCSNLQVRRLPNLAIYNQHLYSQSWWSLPTAGFRLWSLSSSSSCATSVCVDVGGSPSHTIASFEPVRCFCQSDVFIQEYEFSLLTRVQFSFLPTEYATFLLGFSFRVSNCMIILYYHIVSIFLRHIIQRNSRFSSGILHNQWACILYIVHWFTKLSNLPKKNRSLVWLNVFTFAICNTNDASCNKE